ncbi:hypothetical protein N7450_002462 [Penicillium hetheringtonii]|uniref:Uncharacterized protein n=1 Tax=Penicillium hetheringtonii TaxID=911720 RepID=A0AAD6GZF3_9EURO|nr:hypothetical protein N7450_002462 [Penicillium hetheringtonii]
MKPRQSVVTCALYDLPLWKDPSEWDPPFSLLSNPRINQPHFRQKPFRHLPSRQVPRWTPGNNPAPFDLIIWEAFEETSDGIGPQFVLLVKCTQC